MLLPAKTMGDDNSRTFEYAGDVRKNRGDCARSLSGAGKAFRKMRLFASGYLRWTPSHILAAEILRLPRGPRLAPELTAAIDRKRFSGHESSR